MVMDEAIQTFPSKKGVLQMVGEKSSSVRSSLTTERVTKEVFHPHFENRYRWEEEKRKIGVFWPYYPLIYHRKMRKSHALSEKPLRKSPGILCSQRFSEMARICYTTEGTFPKKEVLKG